MVLGRWWARAGTYGGWYITPCESLEEAKAYQEFWHPGVPVMEWLQW